MRNFLSRKEADELGDALVHEYTGNNAESALFVDVDGLVTEFLRCKVCQGVYVGHPSPEHRRAGDLPLPVPAGKDDPGTEICGTPG